jgi:PPK2 family polyphosphate:nucleotide phosphotransferase
MKLKPLKPHHTVRLSDADARPGKNVPTGDGLEKAIDKQTDRIADLQKVLYADGRYALLIVLQGRDASGKDGTIKKVFAAVNPQGCAVTSFGVPTEYESRHDFLWRVHAQVPARRMIGIFNRSHYEDVIVPRVRKTVPARVLDARYDQINGFEQMLRQNGVVILKFFLHVSRDEQKKRLEDRLADEKKNWKFQAGDLDDRARWRDYTAAYRIALTRCTTTWAPWYLVPADDKKVRNLLVSRAIADTLEGLDLKYPPAAPETRNIKIE